MAKRSFRPEDAFRLRTASDPDLSPDGRRVAFAVAAADQEEDRLRSSIWVAALDGSSEPRRFTEGPADKSPRWSPDGRWLAYISTTDGRPDDAHVRLAPLDGGMPARLGDLPGPVSQLAWSPDSRRLVVVCRVGAPDGANAGATERNAPRVVRGLAARLDGVGWQDGRRHLFVVDVEGGSARQLTRGEYDHADPVVLPGRRDDPVRLGSPSAPRRPPVPRRRMGRARRRWPAAPSHERQRPRRLPGVLARRQDDRVRWAGHRALERGHATCSSFRPTAAPGPRGWRRTSIARPFCSRACPPRCAGPATASS